MKLLLQAGLALTLNRRTKKLCVFLRNGFRNKTRTYIKEGQQLTESQKPASHIQEKLLYLSALGNYSITTLIDHGVIVFTHHAINPHYFTINYHRLETSRFQRFYRFT